MDQIQDFDYITGIKKEWEQSLPKHSSQEWLEIFPEAKMFISPKLLDLKEEREQTVSSIKSRIRLQKQVEKDSYPWWLLEIWKQISGLELVDIEKNIKRLYRFKNVYNPPKRPDNWFSEAEIEAAKATPIEDLIETSPRVSGNRLFFHCPIHEEQTPSFVVYTDDNSAHCYGCSFHANDAVGFIMKTKEKTFFEAVAYLGRGGK